MTVPQDARFVSLREFARRAGVSPSTASEAVNKRRIPKEFVREDGKIDADAALRVWHPQAKGTRGVRNQSARRSEARTEHSPSEHPAEPPAGGRVGVELDPQPHGGGLKRIRKEEPESDGAAVAQTLAALLGVDDVGLAAALLGVSEGEARALKETALAGRRVLELREARGDLLSRAGLAKVLAERDRAARDRLRDLAPRLAPHFAAMEDPAEIERKLQDEIDAALGDAASALRDIAERVRRQAA